MTSKQSMPLQKTVIISCFRNMSLLLLATFPHVFHSDNVLRYSMTLSASATAPKTPPCMHTLLSVAWWLPRSVAPVPSRRMRHSKPRSFASRIVVDTQTSVVMPPRMRARTPAAKRQKKQMSVNHSFMAWRQADTTSSSAEIMRDRSETNDNNVTHRMLAGCAPSQSHKRRLFLAYRQHPPSRAASAPR